MIIVQAIGVPKTMMIPAYLQGALEWIFTDQVPSKTDDALQCSTCHSSMSITGSWICTYASDVLQNDFKQKDANPEIILYSTYKPDKIL